MIARSLAAIGAVKSINSIKGKSYDLLMVVLRRKCGASLTQTGCSDTGRCFLTLHKILFCPNYISVWIIVEKLVVALHSDIYNLKPF